jgi:predicted lactoylglutathione lyase
MKQLFLNLPVSDVEKSMAFYLALGFSINPLFTDKDQKCLVYSDSIYLMLQSREFANSYVKREVIDAHNSLVPSFTLPLESLEMVDEMMNNGLSAGGVESVEVLREDFMYLRSIEDLDGYMWGIMCLDVEKFKQNIHMN